jgi:hypothetical protein
MLMSPQAGVLKYLFIPHSFSGVAVGSQGESWGAVYFSGSGVQVTKDAVCSDLTFGAHVIYLLHCCF